MKKLFIILSVIGLVGLLINCGGAKDGTVKELKNEISKKKGTIDTIRKEIKVLENKITKKTPKDKRNDSRVLVNVKKIKYEKFTHYISQNGSIEAVKSAFISPEMNGQIKKILVREGEFVKKGRLLIKLNSSVIESSIKEVKTALKLATIIFHKREGLWKKKIGSEVQYLSDKTNMESLQNKLDTLKAQLEMSRIKAPINGIIETIYPKEGELATPGRQLIELIDLRKVYIRTDVSEQYLPVIREKNWAGLTFPSYPNIKIDAKVYLVGNSINVKNRTFKLKVLIDNTNGKLKPNNIALIKLIDYYSNEAIIIPSIIIKRDIRGDYVYIVNEDSGKEIAKKQYIKIGLSEGSNTMVLSGLNIGDNLIVKGYNMVKNGIEVKKENTGTVVYEQNKVQKINN